MIGRHVRCSSQNEVQCCIVSSAWQFGNWKYSMLPTVKLHQLSLKLLPPFSVKSSINHRSFLSFPLCAIKCNRFISRRDLTLLTNTSLILLLTSQSPLTLHNARSEEELSQELDGIDSTEEIPAPESVIETSASSPPEVPAAADDVGEASETESARNGAPTLAFLDVSIDGKPTGRIVIELYKDVPVGVARFSSLVSGTAGISYRRKEFVKIMPNYVQHGGIRSYGVDAELSSRTGTSLEAETLMTEWEREYSKRPGIKNEAGTVSIIVRDPLKPPPKLKLVAKQGKFKIEEEEMGADPNGTEFVIALKDSPELDASALVVGKVVNGMDVVEKIGQVKTVQENTSSPYFRVAKLIGDKRAVVAERGFNRPYSKVLITNCGLAQ